jgi:glutamyl endopeptidase
MIDLKSVTKKVPPFESAIPQEETRSTAGSSGSATDEPSRSRRLLVATGKGGLSSVHRWIEQVDADFDTGCIHPDEPLGETVGWFSLGVRSADELTGFRLNISGYPADRGNGNEQYHAVNRVLQASDRRIFYDVDTFGGQSGAPVWIHETPDGPPTAVGIHAYGTGGTPTTFGITANSAPRIIREVFDTVSAWIEQDGGLPPA